MNIWLISDTHFYHDRIILYCNRPQNHTQLIIENWATAVKEDDITIHLGDVIFKQSSQIKNILDSIAGRKILVRGNHDNESLPWYMSHGFDFACDQFVYNNIIFTHAPISVLPVGIETNIHGHLHNAPFIKEKWDLKSRPFNKLFAIELEDYKPVLLDTFVKKYENGSNW
jgi:calcineurin-like phosphoesterase family protein